MNYNPQWDKLRPLQESMGSGGRSGQRPGNGPPSGGSRRPPGGGPPPRPTLPARYLEGGYLDAEGNIKPELLLDHARQVADAISANPGGIKNSQLRKFYGHVRTADTRLNYGADFGVVRPSILQLAAFAHEAKDKGKVPGEFRDFINLNLQHVTDEKSFRQGFVLHFQAVVGYFGNRNKD